MNLKKYINMILLQLSKNYKISVTEITTYNEFKKYRTIKVIIYKTINNKKKEYKTIEARNDRELFLKLKEMI